MGLKEVRGGTGNSGAYQQLAWRLVSLLSIFLDLRILQLSALLGSGQGYGEKHRDRVADLGSELPSQSLFSQRAACCVSFSQETLSPDSQRGLST